MNSEPWRDPLQELWQRQPVPPPPPERTEDRVLRVVQEAETQWEQEAAGHEKAAFAMGWMAGLFTFEAWRDLDDFGWGEWLLVVLMWAMILAALLARRRRLRFERDFGSSILARIERGRSLLRMRQVWNNTHLAAGPVFAIILGLSMCHWTLGSSLAGWITFAVTLPLFTWLYVHFYRKERARLQERFALLDAMQAELAKS